MNSDSANEPDIDGEVEEEYEPEPYSDGYVGEEIPDQGDDVCQ
jgi:hypothetical protein